MINYKYLQATCLLSLFLAILTGTTSVTGIDSGTDKHSEINSSLNPEAAAGLGLAACADCEEDDEMPKSVFEEGSCSDSLSLEQNDTETCALCGGSIKSHEGREFMCKHRFHKQCIRSYVDSQGTFCPVCHKDLQLTNGGSYTKVIAQQIEPYYSTPLKHWGLQSIRKVQ